MRNSVVTRRTYSGKISKRACRTAVSRTGAFKKPERVQDGAHRGRSRRFQLWPIGAIRSDYHNPSDAPKQGSEGASDAWVELNSSAVEGLVGLAVGDKIIVVTWLHRARRNILKVHPRSDRSRPLTGVFATRSPDRPNPLGLHLVTVKRVDKND